MEVPWFEPAASWLVENTAKWWILLDSFLVVKFWVSDHNFLFILVISIKNWVIHSLSYQMFHFSLTILLLCITWFRIVKFDPWYAHVNLHQKLLLSFILNSDWNLEPVSQTTVIRSVSKLQQAYTAVFVSEFHYLAL